MLQRPLHEHRQPPPWRQLAYPVLLGRRNEPDLWAQGQVAVDNARAQALCHPLSVTRGGLVHTFNFGLLGAHEPGFELGVVGEVTCSQHHTGFRTNQTGTIDPLRHDTCDAFTVLQQFGHPQAGPNLDPCAQGAFLQVVDE